MGLIPDDEHHHMKGDDEEDERRNGIEPNFVRSHQPGLPNAKDDEPKDGQERAEKQGELRVDENCIKGSGEHENRNNNQLKSTAT